ncbi:uncharacterized protein LOC124159377 [Ischnura elegans]|uniref:uncharacterized protein LOC124159377 n=1 Tax=Ischnura elegans TaxID=197161 RepID=UPI001ED870DD|nr:uncharacterized protein LOC124159377 [Ischnura elegans]
MAEAEKDWTRLISEVDEVRANLLRSGITELVNVDGILNRLENIQEEYGRVAVVVDQIIAELKSVQPEVVTVDDGEDSSEVELLYQSHGEILSDTESVDDAVIPLDGPSSPRGMKRSVTPNLFLVDSDRKRALTSTRENVYGDATGPTDNTALPDAEGLRERKQDQVNYLMGIFPDVDPEYLKIIAENCRGDDIQLNTFVLDALENKFRLPSVKTNERAGQRDVNMPSCSSSVVAPLEAETTSPTSAGEGAVGGVPGVFNGAPSDQNDEAEKEEKDDLEKSVLYSEQLEYLIGVLPDADPTFLEDKISEFEGNADKLKAFVTEALECPDGKRIYRTRGEIKQKQEHEAQVLKFTKNFSVEDFLEVFPDPVAHFENPQRIPDLNVRNHCLAYLKGRYKSLYAHNITQVLRKENFNLALAVKELDKDKYPKRRTKRPASDCKLPHNQCIAFLQEIAYIENKKLIEEFMEGKKRRRQQKFEEAKAKNELLTCNCCFEDDLLPEDMSSCTDGHLFCIQCVKKGAEVIIGDGKSSFPCMHGDCKAEFSLSTLQGILAPSTFGKLVMRLQAEEVNAAGIEGLEICPSCPYSTIPAPEDKVFKCLNPECMKETCRICKEQSHIPLKCEEVEKNVEVEARTYIENKMTEALVRTCWKCNKKFIKESGCNKMTCTCGAVMCYVCRKPVKDYKHFNPYKDRPSELCPLYSDDAELHVQSVKVEAEKAKEEIMRQNPNINLKHDPTLKLPEKPSSSNQPKPPPLNPFLIGNDNMDILMRNVREYYQARINNRRHDNRGRHNHHNGGHVNNYGAIPWMRDHGYNIPPNYEVPPVIQVAPMPRNHPHHPRQPLHYHRARPYAQQNVRLPTVDNMLVGNYYMPPQRPREQQMGHYVYPPPPERPNAQNNPRR